MNFFFTSIFLYFLSFDSYGLVNEKTLFGKNLQWKDSLGRISLDIHSSESSLSQQDLLSITQTSFQQWSDQANLRPTVTLDESGASLGSNDLYFSNSSLLFSGSGVLAVTQLRYNESTGEILESDIIINSAANIDNDPLSTGQGSATYLGDILVREIGILLGLGHEQSMQSSLVDSIFRGYSNLSSVDKNSIKTLYPLGSYGTIKGKIVGGTNESMVNVFGAYVQAISQTSGEVVATTLSQSGGDFSLEGLDVDEIYYIAVEPLSQENSPPNYYSTAKKNFCVDSDYKMHFFQSCEKSLKGFPIGVSVTSLNSNIDIGNFSIGCGLSVPQTYVNNKGSSVFNFTIDYGGDGVGNAMLGYFTETEISTLSKDEISLDLTGIDNSAGNLFLEIKVITQDLFSNLPLHLNISNIASTGSVNQDFPTSLNALTDGNEWLVKNSELNNNLNIIARVPLDTLASNNTFLLSLSAVDVENELGANYDLNDFFPASSILVKKEKFYLLVANLVEDSGMGNYVPVHKREAAYSDNTKCLQGKNTYEVAPFANSTNTTLGSSERKKTESPGAITCGSINTGGGSGPMGPLSMIFGLLLATLIGRYKNKLC